MPTVSLVETGVEAWDGLVTLYFVGVGQAPSFLDVFCDGFVDDDQLDRFKQRLESTPQDQLPVDFHAVDPVDPEHPHFIGRVSGLSAEVDMTIREPFTWGKVCIENISADEQSAELLDPRTA